MKKGVEVITDPGKAKVLVDPMRRELLRLLAERQMTESGLAEALGLSDPSVGYHLKILSQSGLIRRAKEEVEEHGIVQKFYETTASIFLVDGRSMPLEIERYFMPVRLERALGVIATLSLAMKEPLRVSTEEVEDFAKALDSAIIETAHNYPRQKNEEREDIIRKIYRNALMRLRRNTERLPESIRRLLATGTKGR